MGLSLYFGSLNSALYTAFQYIANVFNRMPLMYTGSGSPEGVISAKVGALYTDEAGSTSTTLYVKETGTGNTGWVAK